MVVGALSYAVEPGPDVTLPANGGGRSPWTRPQPALLRPTGSDADPELGQRGVRGERGDGAEPVRLRLPTSADGAAASQTTRDAGGHGMCAGGPVNEAGRRDRATSVSEDGDVQTVVGRKEAEGPAKGGGSPRPKRAREQLLETALRGTDSDEAGFGAPSWCLLPAAGSETGWKQEDEKEEEKEEQDGGAAARLSTELAIAEDTAVELGRAMERLYVVSTLHAAGALDRRLAGADRDVEALGAGSILFTRCIREGGIRGVD